jgi:sugar lactone lactonase YvrE
MATIITKFSSTPSSVPSNTDLVQGELAVNTADKRLYTEDNGNVIIELGTNPSSITTPSIILDGRDLATDRTKLDGIEPNATADQTDAEIKTAYENNADTNAFTDSEKTKLGTVESGADVTNATNVDAAGAVMNTDTSTAAMGFVIDEDDMASNSDTKVPTQQSVEARIQNRITAIGALMVSGTPVLNDYARFTSATEIEGRSYAEVRVDLGLEIGTDVQAELSGLAITNVTASTSDKVLIQDVSDSNNLKTVLVSDILGNVITDPTLGTLTKTFIANEIATITLSSAPSGQPVVSVSKEVPQTGITTNYWDVNSTDETYTRTNYATATTLTPSAVGNGTFTLGSGSFSADNVGMTIYGNGGVAVLTSTSGDYETSVDFADTSTIASGDWEMYAVVYNTVDDDLEITTAPVVTSTPYDISGGLTLSESFSVGSQVGNISAVAFNSDGTKMFALDQLGGRDVNEYTLSTAYDVSTATFVDAFIVNTQAPSPTGVAFSADGTTMIVVCTSNDAVFQYTLSTGFDVSTASYASKTFSISGQEASPTGIALNSDGTKMFIVGSQGDDVNEYTLSTGYDVTTASFVDSFSVATEATSPSEVIFNPSGTKMYVVGQTTGKVFQYSLSTGFDVSTASYDSVGISVSSEDTAPKGLALNGDGTKLYIGGDTNNTVYGYDITELSPSGYHAAHTAYPIDSAYWTDINSMTVDEAAGAGNVYYAVSTDGRAAWTVIDNTNGERDIVRNNGGTWQYNSNATYNLETWVNGTTNTELATLEEAMETAQNRMDKTQLEAVTDPNHYALGNSLDLAIMFNQTTAGTAPSSDGVSINYDANTLQKGAINGTDYEWDYPASDKVRITALAGANLKIRVV